VFTETLLYAMALNLNKLHGLERPEGGVLYYALTRFHGPA